MSNRRGVLRNHGDSYLTVIRLGSVLEINAARARVFTNAVVEHGFMSCRAMLEFLGVGVDRAQTGLAHVSLFQP